MTREQFFDWAAAQKERFEFDGFVPVAMGGSNLDHNMIALALNRALHGRLRGTPCRAWALDAGIATRNDGVRYPDGVVGCSGTVGTDLLVPNPIVVFEVISPHSGRIDRLVKFREYAAVASIMRYVILESTSADLTVMERRSAGDNWTVTVLTLGDVLRMPEIGIEAPIAEFYEGIAFPA